MATASLPRVEIEDSAPITVYQLLLMDGDELFLAKFQGGPADGKWALIQTNPPPEKVTTDGTAVYRCAKYSRVTVQEALQNPSVLRGAEYVFEPSDS